jgi:transcriptional regulator with XRE-family HTH domain
VSRAEIAQDLRVVRGMARRMRTIRQERGISARRLAELAGLSQGVVAYLELLARDVEHKMDVQNIGLLTACRIADALQVSRTYLCFGEMSPDEKNFRF